MRLVCTKHARIPLHFAVKNELIFAFPSAPCLPFRLADDEKMAARAKLIEPDGRLTLHLGGLEKICVANGACTRVHDER